jgi:cytidine deaminase
MEAGGEPTGSERPGKLSQEARATFRPMDWEPLIAAATAARANSYSPYSRFPVGAALLMDDGSIFAGANVEYTIPTLTVCAERNALATAVAAGGRKPVAVAVVTETSPPSRPCGLCRQALFEFADDLPILVCNLQGEREEVRLSELLPQGFRMKWPLTP